MIILKIKDAGHTIAIPGLQVFRSPVDLDISKLDIRVVSMYLKTSGIEKYEIIAETPKGGKEIYTKKDFDVDELKKSKVKKDDSNERFNRLEKMMEVLLTREVGKPSQNKEQITNKLDNLERLFKSGGHIQLVDKTKVKQNKLYTNEPKIEELESFIPQVDVSDMKIISDVKTIKQDNTGLKDAANMLSGLIKR